jgi:hypothetical protein
MMEDPMNTTLSTAARRTVFSTLAALVLTAALPQTSTAMTAWKVDPAKSRSSSGSVTLTIESVGAASQASGSFIVVANGNVYRVTGPTANDRNGAQPADYGHLTTQGKAVLIGTKARATNQCGSNCRFGVVGPSMSLTFKPASGAGQEISDMLAEARTSAPPSR